MYIVIHQHEIETISCTPYDVFLDAMIAADVIGDSILDEIYDPEIGKPSLPNIIYYNNLSDFVAIRIDTPRRHYITVLEENDNV